MFKKILLLASLLLLLAGGQALANSFSTFVPAQKISNPSTNSFHKIDLASQASAKQPEKITTPSIIAYILPAIVALVIIIGFSGYWLIFRRKHL